MKKIYLLLVAFAFYSQTNAQTLNEPANWPNPEWTLSGTYSAAAGALEADPSVSANFAFDDDDAGSVSNDNLITTSPVMDLTAAHTAGETSLKITVQYIFRKLGSDEILQFEYWDADTSTWVFWSALPGNDTASQDNFCSSAKTTFVSDVLSILNFTSTQLSGFRYRIHWDDSLAGGGYQWGFCLDAPTIQSLSCADPGGLNVTAVTTETATLAWTVNPAISLYNIEFGDTGFTPGSGTMQNGVSNPVTISGLSPQTAYQYYVQSNCGANGLSDWAGPFAFTTACEAVADFNENFDASATGTVMPDCWSTIVNAGSTFANVQIVNYDAFSDPNSVELYNSGDGAATLMLVSPNVSSMNNMRVKFRAYGGSGYSLNVGTMTSPGNAATFTVVDTKTMTGSFADFNVTLNGAAGNYVAFKHGLGGTFRTLLIDNIVFEEIPSSPPACVSDVVVTPDASCGNFATAFAWSEVEGADGYRLKVGTTSGGNELVDNIDLGNVTSYSLVGAFDTTYYYTLTAYNASGNAVGCTEDTFTTAADGCYCTSVPSSNDGEGITNVQVGATDFAITDVTYSDKTADGAVDLPRAISANVQMTISTFDGFGSYTYDTNVWVDFNDDFIFDSSELVFDGVAPAESPTTLNASFVMPLTAPLGEHRMRIGTADSGQATPNPCYNGSYGNTVDILVNVTPAPNCLPPTDVMVGTLSSTTASVAWMSASSTFNIEYGNAPLAQGSGTPVNGVTGTSYNFSALDPQTAYQFYIQTDCGAGDTSPWAGPFSFTTLCDPFGDLTEDFNTLDYQEIPQCWSSIENVDNEFGYVGANDFSGTMQLYNSDDANAELVLITPQLTDLPLNTHRAKFKASGGTGYVLLVGTMSNPTDGSTFELVQSINLTGTMTDYSVAFNASTTDGFVAFKHGVGDTYRTINIDDFVWEPIPTIVPDCAVVTATPDPACGNFDSMLMWDAVENADGYRVTVGTTSGGNDIADNVDVASMLEFMFAGNYNTTYFFKVVPYNALGSAVGCSEDSFTTAPDGCYCESMPTSNDGSGINNVQLATTDFVISDVMYADVTADGTVDITQGESTNLQVTISTFDGFSSYGYDMNVWVDFNDNYTFEANELLISGESAAVTPTTLDLTFTTPADATLGEHRMRIGAADSGQDPANACYSGSYGVTVDINVNVVPLSNDDFSSAKLKVYPNPVKNVLFLEYAKNISNVEIFNIIGQQVVAKAINSNQSQIDMSNLAAGTYLVKVTSENQVKTIKVVKQ